MPYHLSHLIGLFSHDIDLNGTTTAWPNDYKKTQSHMFAKAPASIIQCCKYIYWLGYVVAL